MYPPKIIALLIVLMTAAFAEEEKTEAVALSDIKAFKYTIGATGDAGEVVILKWSRTWTVGKNKQVSNHHTVSYNPGKRCEGSVTADRVTDRVVDKVVDKVDPKWRLEHFGGAGSLSGEYSSSSKGDDFGTIKFTNKKGQTFDYRFSVVVMSYQEAVGIYDGLPSDSSTGWKWAGEPKKVEQPKKAEQSGDDQTAAAVKRIIEAKKKAAKK